MLIAISTTLSSVIIRNVRLNRKPKTNRLNRKPKTNRLQIYQFEPVFDEFCFLFLMSFVSYRCSPSYLCTIFAHHSSSDHCMVSFVKPSLLGTRREFSNRFVNPITNGQHSDSTAADVRLMKRRAHVLHEMLDGCVQVTCPILL